MKEPDESLLTPEGINEIAEIVAEIWLSGKNYSQVFDFHECSKKQGWVARLAQLAKKARQEDCPECEGEGIRVGEDIQSNVPYVCLTCNGTGKVQKAEPKLREKIAEYTYYFEYRDHETIKWELVADVYKASYYQYANQIIALIKNQENRLRRTPVTDKIFSREEVDDLIDEAYKQEKERIVEVVEGAGLTPTEIGDNLILEVEGEYPCSDGSSTMTVSVDKLLEAQLQAIIKAIKEGIE